MPGPHASDLSAARHPPALRRRPRGCGRRSHEHALRNLCAGRDRFPTNRELVEAGLGGLYARLYRHGELDMWAARLGLVRQRSNGPTTRSACIRMACAEVLSVSPRASSFATRASRASTACCRHAASLTVGRAALDSHAGGAGTRRRSPRRWVSCAPAAAASRPAASPRRRPWRPVQHSAPPRRTGPVGSAARAATAQTPTSQEQILSSVLSGVLEGATYCTGYCS